MRIVRRRGIAKVAYRIGDGMDKVFMAAAVTFLTVLFTFIVLWIVFAMIGELGWLGAAIVGTLVARLAVAAVAEWGSS